MAFLIQTISRFFCKTTHYFDENQTFVCVHKQLFLAYILILCCDNALLVPFFLFLIRFVGWVLRALTHALLVFFFRCIYIRGVSCVAFTCKEVGTKRRQMIQERLRFFVSVLLHHKFSFYIKKLNFYKCFSFRVGLFFS